VNNQTDLNAQVISNLQAIWKGGSVVQPTWTPEQIHERAMQFEVKSRRMAWGDLVSFLLLPLILLGIVFVIDLRAVLQESWGRIQFAGGVLLSLCSLIGLLASRRHSYAVTSNADDLLASHLERLARLRDWYASTPWGAGLYLPGIVLVFIGIGLNPNGGGWEKPIIWVGVTAFVYIAACIQTRIKAHALQREIDSLKPLRQD
jgi:hypothetical protein